ncbi:MAG: hypothetical protein UT22_C0003G0013 [Parcubacteria group bacterium GW2011_GWC2_39_11]|nr:MAG: hypothetical protein UT22_C0003G0013 [Parcubacteria group bacterium GW2011_GWC2_39_11]
MTRDTPVILLIRNFNFMPEQVFQQKEKLIGIGDLFRNVWKIYSDKFLVLAGIAVVPGIFYFFLGIISGFAESAGTSSQLLFFIIRSAVFLLAVCGLVINILANCALIFAIIYKDQIGFGIKESFSIAWSKFFSYAWVSFLAGIFIFSGFFLFIIPGIIFFVWFAFSLFVFADEGVKRLNGIKGMSALFRSKGLVRGYWWKIFWRFFVLFFIFFIVAAFVNFISDNAGAPFLGNIFSILAAPFILVFNFSVYNGLKSIKEGIPFVAPERREKIKLILICLAGVLVAVVIILAVITPSLWLRLII